MIPPIPKLSNYEHENARHVLAVCTVETSSLGRILRHRPSIGLHPNLFVRAMEARGTRVRCGPLRVRNRPAYDAAQCQKKVSLSRGYF
jgi:hypothetical protein